MSIFRDCWVIQKKEGDADGANRSDYEPDK